MDLSVRVFPIRDTTIGLSVEPLMPTRFKSSLKLAATPLSAGDAQQILKYGRADASKYLDWRTESGRPVPGLLLRSTSGSELKKLLSKENIPQENVRRRFGDKVGKGIYSFDDEDEDESSFS
eukprot:CAMPEP_0184486056 /NCGR_PEP_ID=MMETSP0113_2-20130426/7613_1 /TAXON_ID=91329 /ORGANISM="Norrisiella sphaerica, Strain BC52" /LENGTH=121 /DNA_ID=CAMNT_0026867777 /DNA_START=178 /DNA_END=543 /DNA_ORIENTATION=+